MNKLWHFGDSFGTCGSEEVIFSKYISNHLNLELEHKSVGGYSNSKIFSEILFEVAFPKLSVPKAMGDTLRPVLPNFL